MQAMFNLLLRFCPRKSAGKPNATAPAARELVLINSRRSTRESTAVSGAFKEGNFGLDTRSEYTAQLPTSLLESLLAAVLALVLINRACVDSCLMASWKLDFIDSRLKP